MLNENIKTIRKAKGLSRMLGVGGGVGRHSARRQVDDKCFAASDLIFTYMLIGLTQQSR